MVFFLEMEYPGGQLARFLVFGPQFEGLETPRHNST
jgi:hypothetical protein